VYTVQNDVLIIDFNICPILFDFLAKQTR
jgi:hypothetical protein